MTEDKLRSAKVIDWLPSVFGGNEGVPQELIGATVTRVGTYKDSTLVETGGLVIDYKPSGSDSVSRVVFGFNDTAMWVVAELPEI